ncbi:hypothetical protein CONPUDRAFT_74402 [Coniophora puteana RWD-64-598 SS2]|uniref:Uncharacterized protein n=1 Tax=Coniophora puteana (strain RWD-64-598) TaxID=741705 RepID=A0A5M3MJM5_CONPW|nr:uncharacterized protein CONPUDRAFT_74402 [Coniophora puteana RWD-64-598 SS2]EIW78801.1 hypothetical protein CONPUDRAFT_74402 [Coniophora puteana RWD-64-598 SS2]
MSPRSGCISMCPLPVALSIRANVHLQQYLHASLFNFAHHPLLRRSAKRGYVSTSTAFIIIVFQCGQIFVHPSIQAKPLTPSPVFLHVGNIDTGAGYALLKWANNSCVGADFAATHTVVAGRGIRATIIEKNTVTKDTMEDANV